MPFCVQLPKHFRKLLTFAIFYSWSTVNHFSTQILLTLLTHLLRTLHTLLTLISLLLNTFFLSILLSSIIFFSRRRTISVYHHSIIFFLTLVIVLTLFICTTPWPLSLSPLPYYNLQFIKNQVSNFLCNTLAQS